MTRDRQTITPDWEPVGPAIDGVHVKRTRNVLTANGWVTEAFQAVWPETGCALDRTLVVHFESDVVTDWYVHAKQTDFIFPLSGRALLALFDGRAGAATEGTVVTQRLDPIDPVVVVVPPGVHHAFKVLQGPFSLLNGFDLPYDHAAPDQSREPADSGRIPFDIRTAR